MTYDVQYLMHWTGPTEKDGATTTLEKRLWDTANTATRASANLECEATWRDFRQAIDHWRAHSELKSQEYSGPIRGVIFRRFAAQRVRMEKAACRMVIGFLLLASTVLSAVAASGLSTNERGELLLNGAPFRGVGVNYFDAFTRTLGKTARTNYDAGFRELAARKIPFARFSAGGFWPQD